MVSIRRFDDDDDASSSSRSVAHASHRISFGHLEKQPII